MDKIKKNFNLLVKNQLIAGSAVLFVGNGLISFGNYLYHLLMGRMLGPVDYGLLASLISITYLLGIPVNSLNLVIVKYVSALKGKRDFGAINYFYRWLGQKTNILLMVAFLVLALISPGVKTFLHFESVWPYLMVVSSSLVGVYLIINQAMLQGFLRFDLMVLVGVLSVVAKLLLAVGLVFAGWRVLGASFSILISSLIGVFLAVKIVSRLLKGHHEEIKIINLREIFRYSLPVLLAMMAFTSLYTTDIVLVRHFLSASEAGYYAALATLGKIIFFAANPIIMVMFPMISEKHAKGKDFRQFLIVSLVLVLLICLGISALYLFLPVMMIRILYGQAYLAVSPQLWLMAVFLSLYSLSYLLANFYLSIGKVKVVVLPVIAALIQIVLIIVFHRGIKEVITMSIISLTILMISLLLYFKKAKTTASSRG